MNKGVKKVLGLAAGLVGLAIINSGPNKYSREWIQNLSDEEWATQREEVRKRYCDPQYSDQERTRYQSILYLFDKIKSERDWAGETPHGPGYHREHGYNLAKDD